MPGKKVHASNLSEGFPEQMFVYYLIGFEALCLTLLQPSHHFQWHPCRDAVWSRVVELLSEVAASRKPG